LKAYILVALGGGIGSLLRFGISQLLNTKAIHTFPWATFLVNLLGCFLIGLLIGLSNKYQFQNQNQFNSFFLIGICGGFTTFSTFSVETLRLLQNSQNIQAILYIIGSILLGLALTFLGYFLFASR